MKKGLALSVTALCLLSLILFNSCSNNDTKTSANKGDTIKPVRTNVVEPDTKKEKDPAGKSAIINIIDTVSVKKLVIYMKDSAKVFDRISLKLGTIYGVKLAEVLKKNGLKMTGAPMAWYKTQKAPYFFEAGIPVNKRPAKLPANVFVREIGVDSVYLAHFYGPYNLLSQGYDALKERLKDEKRHAAGAPYEIYVNDPVDAAGKAVDPYKVRTDIVFPRN